MNDAPHVVCPHCDSINRLPGDKPPSAARCGRCHQPLFTGRPITLDSTRFPQHLTRGDLPLLVDFWASWCGPCKLMAPVFEEAAGQLEPRVRLAKVNTEEQQGLAVQWGVRSIPTLILFKNGQEAARIAGAMDLPRLVAWTRQHL